MRKLQRIAQVVLAQGMLWAWRASEVMAGNAQKQPQQSNWAPKFQDVTSQDLTTHARAMATGVVEALVALFTIVFIGAVIWNSKKLAWGGSDPRARSEAMSGYLWIMVAGIAAFAATTLAGVAYWIAQK